MLPSINKQNIRSWFTDQNTGQEQVILISIAFSIAIVLFRVIYTGHLLFIFLGWNLFLALIPYFITRMLISRINWIENNIKFWVAFTLWLLFIPNSFYILTDLFHLENRPEVPFWFDLALIVSYAWNGVLLGILSLRQMEKIVLTKFSCQKGFLFTLIIIPLNAFGIYIGRYLRYNSWDIIASPSQLLQDIIYLCIHPIRNRFDWSMIICYSVLLMIMYMTIKKLSRELC